MRPKETELILSLLIWTDQGSNDCRKNKIKLPLVYELVQTMYRSIKNERNKPEFISLLFSTG